MIIYNVGDEAKPVENWDLRNQDPEEHLSKSSNRGTF